MPQLNISRRWALSVVLGLLAVGLAVAFIHSPPPQPVAAIDVGEAATAAVPIPSPDMVTLHVSGAVLYPGLVVVVDGGRVADAIAAPGGAAPGADLALVNLAAPVVDGMQLRVPRAGEQGAAGGPNVSSTSDGLVDLNRADASELTRLPGVGSVLAARIVTYRELHGPFETIEDLLDVSGIGEGKLVGIREGATVR